MIHNCFVLKARRFSDVFRQSPHPSEAASQPLIHSATLSITFLSIPLFVSRRRSKSTPQNVHVVFAAKSRQRRRRQQRRKLGDPTERQPSSTTTRYESQITPFRKDRDSREKRQQRYRAEKVRMVHLNIIAQQQSGG